jgi:uncharacterized protein YndB with AHSA1/START domain
MTDHIQGSERPLGTLRFAEGRGTVRMEDVYDTDIDDLWSALVEPARLARWIADVTGDLRVGGSFRATFTSGWKGSGSVTVCDAPGRLLVTLDPGDDYEQEMTIDARLSAEGDKTRLVIEDSGFSRDDLAGHGAGWQAHVEDLVAYLAGQKPGDWEARWRQLSPLYVALAESLD